MIFIEEHSAFFLIGGSDGKEMSKIARFMGGVWSDGGNLNAARHVRLFDCYSKTNFIVKNHRAEWVDNTLIVAGGTNMMGTENWTEQCELDELGKFNCVNITPSLARYIGGSSFVVSSDFCI